MSAAVGLYPYNIKVLVHRIRLATVIFSAILFALEFCVASFLPTFNWANVMGI